MANIPDFRPQPQGDLTGIARLQQNKAIIEENARLQKRKERSERFGAILDAVQTGQKIAEDSMVLAEMRKGKKDLSKLSGRDIQQIEVIMPTGQRKSLILNELTQEFTDYSGRVIPKEELKGALRTSTVKTVTDSEGNVLSIDPVSGKVLAKTSTAAPPTPKFKKGTVTELKTLPSKTRTEVSRKLDQIKSESAFRAEFKSAESAIKIVTLMKAKNWVFDQKIGLQLARAFGDAGNISVVEQKEGKESKQLLQQGKQLLETYIKTGKLTTHNRSQIIKAAEVMEKAGLANMKDYTDMFGGSIIEQYPELNKKAVDKMLIGAALVERINAAKGDWNTSTSGVKWRVK